MRTSLSTYSRLWGLILIMLVPIALKAQQKIIVTGAVQTVDSIALPRTTVLLIQKADSLIVDYTQTNEKGIFWIQLPFGTEAISQYLLKVNLLGYQPQEIQLHPDKRNYSFFLKESYIQLKEAVITNKFPVVKMRGDTTTYRADDFAGPQDRTIGDVLKKIPGLEVADNGQISFNGKNIGKLYLDGDDLLESKYNMATRVIPNSIVNQIQVLENHQSIKALEGKVFSDAVNINLTFKDKAKLRIMGQADAGAGLPNLYENELNAISLKDSYKAIHTAKLNNTARSLADEVASLDSREALKRGKLPQASQLSTGTGSYPPLDQKRYFFNHSGLGNSANLWKLKSDVQLKSKAYYQYDHHKQVYQNLNNFLLPEEVIRYSEEQNNSILGRNMYADLILQQNKSQFYLNNKFSYESKNRQDEAFLMANSSQKLQQYREQDYAFSNEIDLIRAPKSKTLTQYYSYLSFQSHPETLTIDSLRAGIFQTTNTLHNITQQIRIPTFFTNNYVTIQNSYGRFSQSYQLGLSTNIQQYQSFLQAKNTDFALISPDSSTNRLLWNDYKLFLEPNYEWLSGDFRMTLKLPLRYQWIHAEDLFYQYQKDDRRLLPNANFTIRYNRQKGFSGNIVLSRSNSAGSFLESYQGLVLHNYRSFKQNDDFFSTSRRYNMSVALNYKNPIRFLLINLTGSYQENLLNTIAYQRMDTDLSFTERHLMNNTSNSYNLKTGINKYLFNLKSTVELSYSIQYGNRKQLINEQLYPFIDRSQLLSGKWNGSISKNIRYMYQFGYQTYNNYSPERSAIAKPYAIKNAKHEANMEFDLSSNLFLKSSTSLVNNKNSNGLNSSYLFTDLSALYKLNKLRTDIVMEGRNLSNVKSYAVALSSLNRQSYYEYPLRSRMFILKAKFTL